MLAFVERVTDPDTGLPPEERVAVFDNDGTLWCEKPMPIQLDFILRRLVAMVQEDPEPRRSSSRGRRPPSATTGGSAPRWPSTTPVTTPTCRRWPPASWARFADISVDDFATQAEAFLRGTSHPTLGRGYLECAYAPMVELLGYLEANGFTSYIVSGGGRDFMRPISRRGLRRPERAGHRQRHRPGLRAATSTAARSCARPRADYLDDGPEKPVRIWNRIGRRPVLAGGNSNGDIEMLDWTRHPSVPSLRLLVLHDDAEREFDYVAGSERALELAAANDWTVVSVKNDWATVF